MQSCSQTVTTNLSTFNNNNNNNNQISIAPYASYRCTGCPSFIQPKCQSTEDSRGRYICLTELLSLPPFERPFFR